MVTPPLTVDALICVKPESLKRTLPDTVSKLKLPDSLSPEIDPLTELNLKGPNISFNRIAPLTVVTRNSPARPSASNELLTPLIINIQL